MPFKYDAQGAIVCAAGPDGKTMLPVFIHADGKETPFDADGTVQRISTLNSEAQQLRLKKEEAETKLKPFESITDPAAAIKALDIVKNLDDKKLVDAGKVEEVRAAAVRAYEEKLTAASTAHAEVLRDREGKITALTTQLNNEVVGGNFARSKYIAEKLVLPVDIVQATFGKHFKVEDGKLKALDAAGNPIYSRARPGDPNVGFDEAMEIIIDAYPSKAAILKGNGASGGGAGGSGGGGGGGGGKTMTRAAFDALNPEAKGAAMAAGTTLTD